MDPFILLAHRLDTTDIPYGVIFVPAIIAYLLTSLKTPNELSLREVINWKTWGKTLLAMAVIIWFGFCVAMLCADGDPNSTYCKNVQAMAIIMSVAPFLGQSFPITQRLRPHKGIGTYLIILTTGVGHYVLPLWLVLYLYFRRPGIPTLITFLSLPIVALWSWYYKPHSINSSPVLMIILSVLLCIMVVSIHRSEIFSELKELHGSIKRRRAGTEPKIWKKG